ncbi:hypothetical protein DK926_19335 [Rhodococcus sp. Eu-32]|uniref:hypothetical protein n=1 Tax=Rhodococcus sp. Eu-32 TaxID=1017319 RepID=UPI000DF2FA50|nr:hypothetical protein [Rhodococcus sp. Eu-32]RRQ26154.1 hypothetical protein DK926_19335 [Rhodococcus sp. Eu-32]
MSSTVYALGAAVLAQIPTGDDRIDPPAEVTAQFEQLGRWFFWGVTGALAVAGVLAGVYLSVAYHDHGRLGEGEKKVALVAVCAVIVGTSGGWAPILL